MNSLLLFCIIIGIVISFTARGNVKKRKGWKSTLSIILKDYTFEDFVYLNLLSLIFAIGQGGFIGASVGYMLLFVDNSIKIGFEPNVNLLQISFICLLSVLLLRLSLEGIFIVFKSQSSAIKWFTLRSQLTLNSHPELKDDTNAEQEQENDDGWHKPRDDNPRTSFRSRKY